MAFSTFKVFLKPIVALHDHHQPGPAKRTAFVLKDRHRDADRIAKTLDVTPLGLWHIDEASAKRFAELSGPMRCVRKG